MKKEVKFMKNLKNICLNEEGQALMLVLGVVLIVTLFATALITITVNRVNATFVNQQTETAQAAADYGLALFEGFQNAFGANWPTYCVNYEICAYVNGSTNQVVTPKIYVPSTNEFFSITEAPVPTPNNTSTGWFSTCRIAISKFNPCVINVTITGYYLNQNAYISFNLIRNSDSYLHYVYYTNYETADPADSVVYPSGQACGSTCVDAFKYCPFHNWPNASPQPNPYYPSIRATAPDYTDGCVAIEFGPSDYVSGPMFTNDDPFICGATFNGIAYTGDSNAGDFPYWNNPGGCGNPNFMDPNNQRSNSLVSIGFVNPPPNANSLYSLSVNFGCVYYGPTLVTLKPGGMVNVISPDTRSFPPSDVPAKEGLCGQPNSSGPGTGCLGQNTGCTLNWNVTPLGVNGTSVCGQPQCQFGVFYVLASPTNSSDPNYWSGGAPTCSSNLVANYYWAINSEAQASSVTQCLEGDLLIQGDPNTFVPRPSNLRCSPGFTCYSGGVPGGFDFTGTGGAADNIIIVGNLVDNNGTSSYQKDNLGLVATNFIEVNNPNCTFPSGGCNYFFSPMDPQWIENPVIDAALLAAANSFAPINWNVVTPYEDGTGFLNTTGAIVQDFRGIVGYVGYSGWDKNYSWNSYLVNNPPPGFPTPPYQRANFEKY